MPCSKLAMAPLSPRDQEVSGQCHYMLLSCFSIIYCDFPVLYTFFFDFTSRSSVPKDLSSTSTLMYYSCFVRRFWFLCVVTEATGLIDHWCALHCTAAASAGFQRTEKERKVEVTSWTMDIQQQRPTTFHTAPVRPITPTREHGQTSLISTSEIYVFRKHGQ